MNAELLGIATVVVVLFSLGGFCLVENSDIQLLPEIEEEVIETYIPPVIVEKVYCYPGIDPGCS